MRILLILAVLTCAGCAVRKDAPAPAVSQDLLQRVGQTLPPEGRAVPPDVNLSDGLTQEEAVAVALWNNADFQVSVSALGFARADLVEAGLLRNPVFSILFPVGPKQLEAALRFPIEVLWERPRRVAAASFAEDAAAQRLVQTGLDLAAEVKIAHADLALAEDRRRLAEETAQLAERINTLTQSRLKAGDISALEARAAFVDAADARHAWARLAQDIEIARARLRALLGFAIEGPAFEIARPDANPAACGPSDMLLSEALVSRPDLRAAELSVEAAGARLGWEKSKVLTLTAVLDANGEGTEGYEQGPGLDIGIPLFDRNQGGRARGAAELERASRAYVAAQQRVALELREAALRYEQARASLESWTRDVINPLQQNVTASERAFSEGDASYLFVLENARRRSGARIRASEFEADLLHARAHLERALGRTCHPEGEPTVAH